MEYLVSVSLDYLSNKESILVVYAVPSSTPNLLFLQTYAKVSYLKFFPYLLPPFYFAVVRLFTVVTNATLDTHLFPFLPS